MRRRNVGVRFTSRRVAGTTEFERCSMNQNQRIRLPKGKRNLARLVSVVSCLSEDKDWDITIKEAKTDRSLEQNNSLYGVAYKALREFTGHENEELHQMFLRAYFGEVEVEVMGMKYVKPRRTTTTDESGARKLLSTAEFNDFYSFVQRKAAEIGCWVPDPDPMWHAIKEERAA